MSLFEGLFDFDYSAPSWLEIEVAMVSAPP
jgi:hypothetical protein